jgi:hypothetical protein
VVNWSSDHSSYYIAWSTAQVTTLLHIVVNWSSDHSITERGQLVK